MTENQRVEVEGGLPLVSTGVAIEALGRMSLDEVEGREKSFGEPQESSEEELGMAFSPGKMVDDIVGEDEKGRSDDAEEIMFSGRATRKQLYSLYSLKLIIVDPVKSQVHIYLRRLLSHQLILILHLRYLVPSRLHHHQRQQQI